MNLSPKEFELLLCEFCKKDLPKNFTVEHDIKQQGEESKNLRQIDTKIKGKVGVSDILICGEAKNWSEPVGSEFIDALVGKYLSGEVRANKVIAFSNNGFYKPAIERAIKLGIELIEPVKLGEPIQKAPYILAIGSIGLTMLRLTHLSPQQNLMSLNNDDYIILKGDERISFNHNIFRLLKDKFSYLKNREIFTDLSKIKVRDANVLYELKTKEGFKYNADFDMEVNINWDYYCLNLPSGILNHLNSNEKHFVHLEGDALETMNKIISSPEKRVYQDKDKCIDEFLNDSEGHIFNMCLLEPESLKESPQNPIVALI